MENICKRPCYSNTEKRHRQDEEVEDEDKKKVGYPDSLAVEVGVCWIGITMCYANIHAAFSFLSPSHATKKTCRKTNILIILIFTVLS